MLKYSKYVKAFGIVLIIVGVFILAYQGIKLINLDKKTSIGPVEIMTEQATPVKWSPYAGFFFIGFGGSLLIWTRKKNPVPESE